MQLERNSLTDLVRDVLLSRILDGTYKSGDRLIAQRIGRELDTSQGPVREALRELEAMRYATLAGGKRFRPFLVAESAALFGVPHEQAILAGAALECIH